jgi:hypothetical protein
MAVGSVLDVSALPLSCSPRVREFAPCGASAVPSVPLPCPCSGGVFQRCSRPAPLRRPRCARAGRRWCAGPILRRSRGRGAPTLRATRCAVSLGVVSRHRSAIFARSGPALARNRQHARGWRADRAFVRADAVATRSPREPLVDTPVPVRGVAAPAPGLLANESGVDVRKRSCRVAGARVGIGQPVAGYRPNTFQRLGLGARSASRACCCWSCRCRSASSSASRSASQRWCSAACCCLRRASSACQLRTALCR